jgi:hypothetical protein
MVVRVRISRACFLTLKRSSSRTSLTSPTKYPFLLLRWYSLVVLLCVVSSLCSRVDIDRTAASSKAQSPDLPLTLVSFALLTATHGSRSRPSRCRSVLPMATSGRPDGARQIVIALQQYLMALRGQPLLAAPSHGPDMNFSSPQYSRFIIATAP